MAQFICCGKRVAKPPLADFIALELQPFFLLEAGFPGAQLGLNRRALGTGKVPSRVATALQAANAWAWAARGQWDSALSNMSQLAATASPVPGVPTLAFQDYEMAVLGALLGATQPAQADQRRPPVVSHLSRLTDQESRQQSSAYLAWLDGVLGYARKDHGAIKTARADVARTGWYQANLVDRSLAAMDQALTGNREAAGRKLAELEEHCISHEDCNSYVPHAAVQRFLAGQWVQEGGDLDYAARLLRWHEAPWGGWGVTLRYALDAPTYMMRARIEETRSDTALALKYYRQFLRRYDRPMPSQTHLVQEAKAALVRLQREQ